MKKPSQKIQDESTMEEILSGGMICRLAMIDGEKPYMLSFNYGYRNRCIYIHSAPEGKKIDLLKKNNQVGFEIEEGVEILKAEKACGWSTKYRSVTGHGEVKILTDPELKKEGLEVIMDQHGAVGPFEFPSGQLERMVVLQLQITSMTGKKSDNWEKGN